MARLVLSKQQIAYLEAVRDVLEDDAAPARPWLTTSCPRCHRRPGNADGSHALVWGCVALDCWGGFVIAPTRVGVHAPWWRDWRPAHGTFSQVTG